MVVITSKGAEELVKSSSSCEMNKVMAPMDLFDEHWFFSNTLNSKSGNRCNSLDCTWNSIKEQRKKNQQQQEGLVSMRKMLSNSKFNSRKLSFDRALMRMPSMPCPRKLDDEFGVTISGKNEESQLIDERAKRLVRAPSLPSPEISKDEIVQDHVKHLRISSSKHPNVSMIINDNISFSSPKSARAIPIRGKPPRDNMKGESANESICRKAFQEKKWKSFSDLETMEVQALRDLGFVLDQNEEPKNSEVSRKWLSESWFVEKSAPQVPKWVTNKTNSSVDMKKQIKFWARAVACNVREEC